MIRDKLFSFRLIIIIIPLFLIFLLHVYLPPPYGYIKYLGQRLIQYSWRNNIKTSNMKLKFIIDEGYWNFSVNSFLHLKLDADISPDMNAFFRNNGELLKMNNDEEIPFDERVKHYGSMSAISVKIKISTNETLTLVFSRVWYSKKICHIACGPDRSYLYVEAITSNYRRISFNMSSKIGKTIKFPCVLNISERKSSQCCLGPEDARVILDENNQILISFTMIDTDNLRKIWLYDIFTGYQAPISVENMQLAPTEKNWTPFIKDNELYLIYSYNPLRILKCSIEENACELISNIENKDKIHYLRGGTQLVKFRDSDYYVGIARTRILCHDCGAFYRPHLVVLSTISGKFRLVYVSETLMVDNIPMFASYFVRKYPKLLDFCENLIRIMTPGSIIDWTFPDDKLTFTISIDDKRSFIASITGIGKVVENLIFAIENEYSQIFSNYTLNLKIASYCEARAFNYCKSAGKTNKMILENLKFTQQYPKEKVIKHIIDSPTYPTFRVTSNTDSKVLSSWIKEDFINFGLIGRYLIDYETAHGNPIAGTHLMIDAGGNYGTYGLYGASLNQSVLVFEALPEYLTLIQESIRNNSKLSERMSLYPFGVSDENRIWKIVPKDRRTILDLIKGRTLNTHYQKSSNNLTFIQAYPLDDFVFQKVSVMKIDVKGFEIRALKGAMQLIRTFGVGAILIEIAPNLWSWNNITMNEGISILKKITSMGKYSPYIIARKDGRCPISKISQISGLIDIKNLSMINMQNGKFAVAPQIFRLNEWTIIMNSMKNNDWSCNFWLESEIK